MRRYSSVRCNENLVAGSDGEIFWGWEQANVRKIGDRQRPTVGTESDRTRPPAPKLHYLAAREQVPELDPLVPALGREDLSIRFAADSQSAERCTAASADLDDPGRALDATVVLVAIALALGGWNQVAAVSFERRSRPTVFRPSLQPTLNSAL